MNRRDFFKGLAAAAAVVAVPAIATYNALTAWRHSEKWYDRYLSYVQCFDRSCVVDGRRHQYSYVVLTTEKWEDMPHEVQQFYLEDRDYSWRRTING
jgi:hypothetical protein